MAKIFLAYNSQDRELARSIETELENHGHESVWGVDELIAGRGWGELMPQRLESQLPGGVSCSSGDAIYEDSARAWLRGIRRGRLRVMQDTRRHTW